MTEVTVPHGNLRERLAKALEQRFIEDRQHRCQCPLLDEDLEHAFWLGQADVAISVIADGASYRVPDWTIGEDGATNSSTGFLAVIDEVEQLIRRDAFRLIAGHAEDTARLVMAQLVHRFGFAPDESNTAYRALVPERDGVQSQQAESTRPLPSFCEECGIEIRLMPKSGFGQPDEWRHISSTPRRDVPFHAARPKVFTS